LASLFKKNDDTQIYLNWNTVFEKYWFIWAINSFLLNLFKSAIDTDVLIKHNLLEMDRIKLAHPDLTMPAKRTQIRLFKTEEELKEYEEFLTKINVPFERS
jgi:hypothetical protein